MKNEEELKEFMQHIITLPLIEQIKRLTLEVIIECDEAKQIYNLSDEDIKNAGFNPDAHHIDKVDWQLNFKIFPLMSIKEFQDWVQINGWILDDIF